MAETIYRMFDEWRMVEPALTAVEDENRSLTFSLLDALAATVQGMLPEGVRRVGVVMDHGVEQIAAILGILRAGAAYVPAEPTFPDGRIRFMMEDCAADCIVSHGAYAGRFDGSVPIVLVEQGFQANESVPAPVVAAPDDLAYVLYASGSTGALKGLPSSNATCAITHGPSTTNSAMDQAIRCCNIPCAASTYSWKKYSPRC